MEKSMKNIVALLTAFLALNAAAYGDGSDAGKSAYSFLKIGVSAKSQAMAGAYVGLADDISCLYDNPAGLTAIIYDLKVPLDYTYEEDVEFTAKQVAVKPNRFIASYMNYIIDFQSGYLGYVKALNDLSSFGVSIQYQDYGSFDKLDEFGENLGTFSAFDMALGLTYSKRINRSLSIGLTGKLIMAKIDSSSSDGMAVDIGGLYRFSDGRTSIGLALKNLGTELKGFTKSHKDPLPFLIDGGFSHSLRGMPLTVNADLTVPTDSDIYLSVGGQFDSFNPLFLRLGWTSKGKDYKTGSDRDYLSGFAAGFGYYFQDYKIDYSYSSMADLGNVHRVSIGVDF
jgi:hypothetical protein